MEAPLHNSVPLEDVIEGAEGALPAVMLTTLLWPLVPQLFDSTA